jgi:hypothetical protein
MWVFTKDGFFSAVWDRDCRGDEITIRSQSRADLIRLIKKLTGYCDAADITDSAGADYRFRVKIPKHAWSTYLADCALRIDYSRVKDHIDPGDDPDRTDAYYRVYETLYRWRSKMDAAKDSRVDGRGDLRLPLRWKR